MMSKALAPILVATIRDSLAAVRRANMTLESDGHGWKLPDGLLDEMARNAAQAVIATLEVIEGESHCLVCGACPICGRRDLHAH